MDWLPDDITRYVHGLPFDKLLAAWKEILGDLGHEAERGLARADRFYLLTQLMHRGDAFHPWLYERCREVEADPDGYLDLWAREHYKSTIITFAGSIQEVLKDPEITIGIFSFKSDAAGEFLKLIKRELESNQDLKNLFPDVLYQKPEKESPSWSEKGIIVRRQSNPREPTIGAHGIVQGMPTGAHFRLRIYDDLVTSDSVTSPDMVKKTTDQWSLSDNLGARGADGRSRAWHIGTRYTYADTYQVILSRNALKERKYPATEDGLESGKPVFLSQAVLDEKKIIQGAQVFAAQMLQNPAAGATVMFKVEWLRDSFKDVRPTTLNIYIMCDPASSKKKGSDNTALVVIGVDTQNNRWMLDGYHHKMGLSERWEAIKALRKRWKAVRGVQMLSVGYERYGSTSDLEYFEERMRIEGDSFEIKELATPLDGTARKYDRIQRLQPYFLRGQFFFPAELERETRAQREAKARMIDKAVYLPVARKDHQGNLYRLTKNFLEEYTVYPFAVHDDFLDAMSRIQDMEPLAPIVVKQEMREAEFCDGA